MSADLKKKVEDLLSWVCRVGVQECLHKANAHLWHGMQVVMPEVWPTEGTVGLPGTCEAHRAADIREHWICQECHAPQLDQQTRMANPHGLHSIPCSLFNCRCQALKRASIVDRQQETSTTQS